MIHPKEQESASQATRALQELVDTVSRGSQDESTTLAVRP